MLIADLEITLFLVVSENAEGSTSILEARLSIGWRGLTRFSQLKDRARALLIAANDFVSFVGVSLARKLLDRVSFARSEWTFRCSTIVTFAVTIFVARGVLFRRDISLSFSLSFFPSVAFHLLPLRFFLFRSPRRVPLKAVDEYRLWRVFERGKKEQERTCSSDALLEREWRRLSLLCAICHCLSNTYPRCSKDNK